MVSEFVAGHFSLRMTEAAIRNLASGDPAFAARQAGETVTARSSQTKLPAIQGSAISGGLFVTRNYVGIFRSANLPSDHIRGTCRTMSVASAPCGTVRNVGTRLAVGATGIGANGVSIRMSTVGPVLMLAPSAFDGNQTMAEAF